jgi:hypothetical protein
MRQHRKIKPETLKRLTGDAFGEQTATVKQMHVLALRSNLEPANCDYKQF